MQNASVEKLFKYDTMTKWRTTADEKALKKKTPVMKDGVGLQVPSGREPKAPSSRSAQPVTPSIIVASLSRTLFLERGSLEIKERGKSKIRGSS